MSNGIKLVIFDFDGTLVDTQSAIVATYQKTLSIMGLPVIDRKKIEGIIGIPIVEGFRIAVPDSRNKEAVDIYHDNFYKEAEGNLSIFEGVESTLESLREKGILLAIASSRGMQSLTKLSNITGLDRYFTLKCGWDSAPKPKPEPDIVLHILDVLHQKPEDTLVVGDTTFDILMGNRAGCKSCGVTFGNHSREKLLTATPDYLIDSFEEILKCI